ILLTIYDCDSLPDQAFGCPALGLKCAKCCSMLRAIPQNELTAFSRFTETFEDVLVISGIVIQVRGNDPSVGSLTGQDSPGYRQVIRVIGLKVNDQQCRSLDSVAEMTFQLEVGDILPSNLFQYTVINSQELGRNFNHVTDLAKIEP